MSPNIICTVYLLLCFSFRDDTVDLTLLLFSSSAVVLWHFFLLDDLLVPSSLSLSMEPWVHNTKGSHYLLSFHSSTLPPCLLYNRWPVCTHWTNVSSVETLTPNCFVNSFLSDACIAIVFSDFPINVCFKFLLLDRVK